MKIKELIQEIESFAPSAYAEDFDNTGLLVGNPDNEITGVLITHDTLEAIVEEAISLNMNLIVSFHPILFKGLKSITGKNYVERALIKAIKNDIAIYAIHTALDNRIDGVSGILAKKLGLQNLEVLVPQQNTLMQLVTYVPIEATNQVRRALFDAGAGKIGNYAECSFNIVGSGTFKALEGANPYVGEIAQQHKEAEERISVVFPKHLQSVILKNLFAVHPYEEVAYELLVLKNIHPEIGLGVVGNLPQAVNDKDFLLDLKEKMNLKCIRHSKLLHKPVRRIAILGGSGSFAIEAAKGMGASVYITSDIKYHEFYQAENQMIIADVGHYESEQYTKIYLFEKLTKKIRNFAVALSKINTNPINYI